MLADQELEEAIFPKIKIVFEKGKIQSLMKNDMFYVNFTRDVLSMFHLLLHLIFKRLLF